MTKVEGRPNRFRPPLLLLLTLLFAGLMLAYASLSLAALGRHGSAWIAAGGGLAVAATSALALDRVGRRP